MNKAFLNEFHKIGKGYVKIFDDVKDVFLTTRDVCKDCNNRILRDLDDYFLDFYRKNIPEKRILKNTKITISYDFKKLSKWLLKTLYNSERRNVYEQLERKLHRYKGYIIEKEKFDNSIRIYVELLQDIPRKHTCDFPEESNGKSNILKLGTIIPSEQYNHSKKDITRYFLSSNIIFHILIFDSEDLTSEKINKRINDYKFLSKTKKIFYLNPIKKKLILKASDRTILEILGNTIEGNKSFIERRKQ
ncbi:hypothetical protein [Tenacibaculum piscium]|uniref:hypothetical protein n=1 Tax=Tenacibaculum piscium TaxID=1458515 RepID=UPI001F47C393|nr:hypothetical protein [Tenacibaculum piscium]